jgi:hypothetical protein
MNEDRRNCPVYRRPKRAPKPAESPRRALDRALLPTAGMAEDSDTTPEGIPEDLLGSVRI